MSDNDQNSSKHTKLRSNTDLNDNNLYNVILGRYALGIITAMQEKGAFYCNIELGTSTYHNLAMGELVLQISLKSLLLTLGY